MYPSVDDVSIGRGDFHPVEKEDAENARMLVFVPVAVCPCQISVWCPDDNVLQPYNIV